MPESQAQLWFWGDFAELASGLLCNRHEDKQNGYQKTRRVANAGILSPQQFWKF